MKILVGTLYAYENEFSECLSSIYEQTYNNFEHFVIEGKPKKEAHDILYGRFKNESKHFDLMIKVDADMVINDNKLFEKIVKKFEIDDSLEYLVIGVHDFFTDTLINGLHVFRNTVKWSDNGDLLFTDRSRVNSKHIYDAKELAPAAFHCKNPSFFQSFHYGVHRGLKCRELRPDHELKQGSLYKYLKNKISNKFNKNTKKVMKEGEVSHWEALELIWKNFNLKNDSRLGFAVLGFELALKGEFNVSHLDINNPFLENYFKKYNLYETNELKKIIKLIRFKNWGFLPNSMRRKIIPLSYHYFK